MSSPKRLKKIDLLIAFFFMSIFLTGCANRGNGFSQAEKHKVEAFFEELLLEHGGAYTLFGSKPVTMENLLNYTESDMQQLEEFFRQHPDIEYIQMERQLEEGWQIWKKKPMVPINSFVLAEMHFPSCDMLVFVNIPSVASTIEQHREDFEQLLGKDFITQSLIADLRIGNYKQWEKLLSDPMTEGILLGYGVTNARVFRETTPNQNGRNVSVSENNDPRLIAECCLNGKPFRIPIFVMFDENESEYLLAKYKKEREQIKKRYIGKDFLEVTLLQLKKGMQATNV